MAARFYVSSALPTVLTSPAGSSGNLVVLGLPGTWPTSYPFTILVDWGESTQEACLVTGAPTGTGPYTLPVTRGTDGTTPQSHLAGAVVVPGTTSYEPNLLQTLSQQITTLSGEIPALPVAVNQGGTGAITAPAALTALGAAPLASPALTGTPTAPTRTALTNNTDIATTAYADAAVGVETSRAEAAEATKGGLLTKTAVKTGAYSAASGDYVACDSTSGTFTVTLPNAPAVSTVVGVKLIASASPANAVTVACAGSDVFNKTSGSTTYTLSLASQGATFQYGSGGIWLIQNDDLPLGQLDARYAQFVNVLAYGADATGTNDSTSAVNAALTVVSASNKGATVFFPTGTYKISGTLAADGSNGVTLLGCGGTTGGAGAGSSLRFSNTGSGALISATSTIGFGIQGMQLIYTSTSFTGNVLDLRNVSAGDSALFKIKDCLFAASSTASATNCINLDKANSGTIDGCNFEGATYGVAGRASGSSYSNANTVRGCQFVDLGTAGIHNPGQGWLIAGNTFENLAGGGAGGVLCDSGAGTYGTDIGGNWFGDATVNSGSPISINGGGFSVHGNYIGYTTGMTAVVIGGSSVGFRINGNRFDNGGGGGTTAISLGSGCVSYDCTANGFPALGVPVPQADAPGTLLAVHQYAPTSLTAYTSTSATLAAIDTTNLTISFTAPVSGNVMVRLHGAIQSNNTSYFVLWGLLDHTSGNLYGSLLEMNNITSLNVVSSVQIITGLTSGTAYQMDWAYGTSGGASGNGDFYAGSLASKTYSNKAVPAVMEVWAL